MRVVVGVVPVEIADAAPTPAPVGAVDADAGVPVEVRDAPRISEIL